MTTFPASRKVKDYLSRGYTGEALALLDAELQPLRRFHDQLVMLQAQYYECQQDERAGVVSSEDAQLRQNKINSGILSLMREIEEAGGLLQAATDAGKSDAKPPVAPETKPEPPVQLDGEIDIPFEPNQLFVWNDPESVMQFKRVFAKQAGEEISLTFELKLICKKTSGTSSFCHGAKWRLFDDQGDFIEYCENSIQNVSALTARPAKVVFRFPCTTRIQSLGLFYMNSKYEDLRFRIDWSGMP